VSLKGAEDAAGAAQSAAGRELVVIPGSVANLGSGFDTLGVAVQVYLRARIVDVQHDAGSKLVVVRSEPPVRGGNAIERAFHALARRTGRTTPTVFVEVDSDIPMAAGLGSSAAATVAGLRVFERITGPVADNVLLGTATTCEGHADNAAPALFGGLTSVIERDGNDPLVLRWPWPEDVRLVVATPAMRLATAKARAALADALPRRDAIFNLQRALAFVHALQHREFGMLREAVRDRWHQPGRAALVPLLNEALEIRDPDVLGAFLSGAGPSIALLVRENAERVEQLLASMYSRAGIEVRVRTLSVHRESEVMAEARLRQGCGGPAETSVQGRTV
jgi:homoserine kinase